MRNKRERFLSEFYDSVQQRGNHASMQENEEKSQAEKKYINSYLGRIRLDSLLSRKLILTDAQLLDGIFFQSLEPTEIIQKTSRQTGIYSIEIKARENRIEDALIGLVKSPKLNTLRGFTFSSIRNNAEREHAKIEMEAMASSKIKHWRDISKMLKEIGVAENNVDSMEASWASWINAQESGLICVKKWCGDFDLDKSFQIEPAQDVLVKISTNEGKEVFDFAWSHRKDLRSTVDIYIQNAKKRHCDNHAVMVDLVAIEEWFNRCYNRAIARQHKCDFESVTAKSITPVSRLQRFFDALADKLSSTDILQGTSTLEIPEDFLARIGEMDDTIFRHLFSKSQDNFKTWWAKGNIDALKRGLYPFIEERVNVIPLPNWAKLGLRIGTVIISGVFGVVVGVTTSDFLNALWTAIVGGTGAGVAKISLDYVIVEKLEQVNLTERLARKIVEHERRIDAQ